MNSKSDWITYLFVAVVSVAAFYVVLDGTTNPDNVESSLFVAVMFVMGGAVWFIRTRRYNHK